MTEEEIRADERRAFADKKWLREVYLDVANMIRFNQTAGGNDGHPISGADR